MLQSFKSALSPPFSGSQRLWTMTSRTGWRPSFLKISCFSNPRLVTHLKSSAFKTNSPYHYLSYIIVKCLHSNLIIARLFYEMRNIRQALWDVSHFFPMLFHFYPGIYFIVSLHLFLFYFISTRYLFHCCPSFISFLFHSYPTTHFIGFIHYFISISFLPRYLFHCSLELFLYFPIMIFHYFWAITYMIK